MGSFNYFNYFTEIEEHFWKKRGAHLLVSPLDWAIVETWQKSGIPLPAVLTGIDRAFESWARSKRAAGGRQLKSLAYCVDAVLDAAEEAREADAGAGPETGRAMASEPFSRDELLKYFQRNAMRLRSSATQRQLAKPGLAVRLAETAERLNEIAGTIDSPASLDLEDIERRLTVLEDKLSGALATEADEEAMVSIRREMDRSLSPYRRKMSAAQLAQLERQYVQKRLFEQMDVPRLSLFYLT
jgi:hypothetical protein